MSEIQFSFSLAERTYPLRLLFPERFQGPCHPQNHTRQAPTKLFIEYHDSFRAKGNFFLSYYLEKFDQTFFVDEHKKITC